MPRLYRKKPVVIEAVQFTPATHNEVVTFLITGGAKHVIRSEGIIIRTLEGDMLVSENDYVIRGVQGEYYPCKPDIFEATYEALL